MKNKILVWRKSFLIGLAAVVISTLGIQASDELNGISSKLSGSVIGSDSACDAGSVLFISEGRSICIDRYEASPSSECSYATPQNGQETTFNLVQTNCKSISSMDVEPWRFVTYTEAKQLCARSGKRLPTNKEWYENALSVTNPGSCFVNDSLQLTGVNKCLSQNGVSDLVGNVWEWMGEVVTQGKIAERDLPDSGYISLVDDVGLVLETTTEPDDKFGSDYAWINSEGVRGILRGGFYGSKSDGGIFSQNITIPLSFASAGVGFRCIKDLN